MKHRMFVIIAAMFIAAVMNCQPSIAQDLRNLTLKEAIELSLRNSKQLKNGEAKIIEAAASVSEAKDRRLPDLKISGAYMHLNNPNVSLQTGKDTGTNGSGSSGNGNTAKVSQAAYGIANLSIPIFSGFRLQYGIESAKFLEQATRLDADNEKEEVVLNTINAFSNLYKSRAAVALVKESLNQARERANEFSNLEKNGLLARNDLLKAELQSSNIELSLLDAENNWKIANVNMNLMLGLPEETALVPDPGSLQKPVEAKTVSEWEQVAIQNRKDISALSQREKAALTGVKAVKGEYYPGFAVTGGYIAAYVPHLLTVTNALNIGLGLQYNLGSLWKTKAKLQQASARVTQLQANEGMLSDAIRLQVNQAYQNLLLSEKKIEVYGKAIEQTSENYKITKNKYDNSLVTTTDLLDAEVAELQAKLNEAFAKTDAIVAYNKLLYAAGVLNERTK